MFIELILRRLNPHVSPRDLAVEIPSRELGPYDVLRWNFISLWEWGAVLEALNREERLARLKARLSSAFTQIDFLALSQLSEPLRTVNGLRGSSSHHSREDLEDKQKRMDQMWSEVIGGVSDKGLVARLVDALGMVVQSSDGT